MQTQLLGGRLAEPLRAHLPSILVDVNAPERNDNWPQQTSCSKHPLARMAVRKKSWGTRDVIQQFLQGEGPNWESKLGKSRRKKL